MCIVFAFCIAHLECVFGSFSGQKVAFQNRLESTTNQQRTICPIYFTCGCVYVKLSIIFFSSFSLSFSLKFIKRIEPIFHFAITHYQFQSFVFVWWTKIHLDSVNKRENGVTNNRHQITNHPTKDARISLTYIFYCPDICTSPQCLIKCEYIAAHTLQQNGKHIHTRARVYCVTGQKILEFQFIVDGMG